MGETSEALFLTSGYTYDDAATVAARFAGEADGMTSARLQNPTVAMLEERIALLEGAEACRAQASGMAAMTTALLCRLSAGDHVVAAKAAFGFVPLADRQPAAALRYLRHHDRRIGQCRMGSAQSGRTPRCSSSKAQPTRQWMWSTWSLFAALPARTGYTTVVDNAFATSALQRPLDFGADVVAYSATKMMDGQAACWRARCVVRPSSSTTSCCRSSATPANLAPFNAWVVLEGLETLDTTRCAARARTRFESRAVCRAARSAPAAIRFCPATRNMPWR